MRSFLSLLLLVLSCSSSWAIVVPDEDWTRLESIFETLKQDNETLRSLLIESENTLIESRTELTKAQKELTTLKQSLNETQNSLQKLSQSLSAIKNDRLLWAVGAGLVGLVLGVIAPGMPWR
jgi:septal ring factor EnvC (AmiA/AmiB activator)